MKISDSLALGSTMLYPIPGVYMNTDKTGGCAWGMIDIAAPSEKDEHGRIANRTQVALPCGCSGMICGSGMHSVSSKFVNFLDDAIVHLFNWHVATTKDWTMERLIDWVRSVEPPEPETKETEECTENRALVAHS